MKKQIRALVLAMLFVLTLLPASGFAGNVTDEAGLAAALTAGGTVTLGGDITVTTMIVIPQGVTSTLDLNGHHITVAESTGNHIYAMDNNGNLTIKDSVGTGSLTARGIYNQDGANITVTNCKIVAQDSNGGACIWGKGGTVTVDNATLIGNCGAIYSIGDLKVTNSTIECYSPSSVPTYAIRAYAKMELTNNTVTSTHGCVSFGGHDGVINSGTYTCTGINGVTSNVLYAFGDQDGDATDAVLTINGGEFKHTAANNPDSGAALVVASGWGDITVNVKGGTFVGLNGRVSGSEHTTVTGGSFTQLWGTTDSWSSLESYIPEHCEFDAATGTVTDPTAPPPAAPAYAGPVMNWVKVNAADNGVVKSGPLAASAGATITLYPKAAEGYVLDTVTVLDASGNTVELDGLKFAVPAGGVTVNATFKLAE